MQKRIEFTKRFLIVVLIACVLLSACFGLNLSRNNTGKGVNGGMIHSAVLRSEEKTAEQTNENHVSKTIEVFNVAKGTTSFISVPYSNYMDYCMSSGVGIDPAGDPDKYGYFIRIKFEMVKGWNTEKESWNIDPELHVIDKYSIVYELDANVNYVCTKNYRFIGSMFEITFQYKNAENEIVSTVVQCKESQIPKPPSLPDVQGYRFLKWDKELVAVTSDNAEQTSVYTAVYASIDLDNPTFPPVVSPADDETLDAYARPTEVLEDLQKDVNFDPIFYPEIVDDHSLKIVQIGESSDQKMFVYVYQPSGQAKKLRASSINISVTIDDQINFFNYSLQLLSSSGTLFKYIVRGFSVTSDPIRYYAISSIYRPFDSEIDVAADHENVTTEIPYAVSLQYCFKVVDGKTYVSAVEIETIVVTDKFVGFVRYKDGFQLYYGACDSHFVAFDTDKPIDKLLEADVFYTKQSYSRSFVAFAGESETFGVKSDEYSYLSYADKVEHTGGGLFATTYKWDRISTVDKFISENDLTQNVYSGAVIDVNVANQITDAGKAALRGKKWVLRFVETDYSANSSPGSSTQFSTLVGDVTILRLKFETDGVLYNLGVIDNKQTGSDKPSNEETPEITLNDFWKTLFAIVKWAAIIACVLLVIWVAIKAIGWIVDFVRGGK